MRRSIFHYPAFVLAVMSVFAMVRSSEAAGGDGAGGIQILTTIIMGVFSVVAALGSVWLKDRLEQRRRLAPPPSPSRPEAEPEDEVKTDEEVEVEPAEVEADEEVEDVQADAEMDEEVEAEPAEVEAPLRHKSGRRFWIRPLIVFSGGFVFGLTSPPLVVSIAEIQTDVGGAIGAMLLSGLAILIALAVVALWLAIFHRRSRGGFWSYQLEVLAIWSAWASGCSIYAGEAEFGFFRLTLILWSVCAIIGGVIITFGMSIKETIAKLLTTYE